MNEQILGVRIRELVVTLLINFVVAGIVYAFTKNWELALIILASLIVVASLAFIIYRAYSILNQSGLTKIHKDAPDPLPLLKKYFNESQRIRVLAIRGARMMGTDRSVINYVIGQLPKKWQGEIQVLLLKPGSKHLTERAQELKKDPNQFSIDCQSSINNILSLKQNYSMNISIRVYDRKPILRGIIFDDRALLSYYIGEKGHIPVQYEIKSGDNTFLQMFNLIFEDLWNESEPV
jgi:hypothetical protein